VATLFDPRDAMLSLRASSLFAFTDENRLRKCITQRCSLFSGIHPHFLGVADVGGRALENLGD